MKKRTSDLLPLGQALMSALLKDKMTFLTLTAALILGGFACLWGISWGLPSSARFVAFPPSMIHDVEMPQKLQSSWKEIYSGFDEAHLKVEDEQTPHVEGIKEFSAAWTWPPGDLVHSYRSILLRSENPDEQKTFTMLARMNPAKFNFKPLYVQYGGFFVYSVGAFLEILAHLGIVHLIPGLVYYLVHPNAMRGLYLAGRMLMLFSTLASIFVLFDIGRRVSGERMGALAALLFALCPAVIPNSHVLKPHPYAALWVFLSIDAAIVALNGESAVAFRLCGIFAGMAAGSNLSFFYFGALPLVAWFWRGRPQNLKWAAFEGAILSFLVFALSNPYLFWDPQYYLWELTVYPRHKAGFSIASGLSFFTDYFPKAMGFGVEILAGLGLFISILRGNKNRFLAVVSGGGLLVLWTLLAFAWGFLNSSASIRFFYPFLGLACLLAADFLTWKFFPAWLRGGILAVILIENSLACFVYLRNLGLNDTPFSTRSQAATWIERNIPAGSNLGLARYPQPYSTPLFRYDRYHFTVFERPDYLKPNSLPQFVVLDQEDYPDSKIFFAKDYTPAAVFMPFSILGASMDDSYYINTTMRIFRRR